MHPKDSVRFAPVGEKEVTTAILDDFFATMEQYVKSDVIIVGGGPSGLVAARDLANAGVRTLVIESNNYLGGGMLMSGRRAAALARDRIGQPGGSRTLTPIIHEGSVARA
jgi:ribulose 1,5-bisphosphate synthetase/thiazole synthase